MGQVDGKVRIVVKDNGIGFDQSKIDLTVSEKGGFGLFNIRERLEYLGGNLNIKTASKKGTCVTMSIPLKSNKAVQKKEGKL